MQFRRGARRFVRAFSFGAVCLSLLANGVFGQDKAPKADTDNRIKTANYILASRWTSAKVGKMLFDTSVTPHWLETGDRFWYSYETNSGRRFYLVDPLRKTKTPVFDNAKMAAMLTNLTRIPYDAQHLPITTIRFINKDTALRL